MKVYHDGSINNAGEVKNKNTQRTGNANFSEFLQKATELSSAQDTSAPEGASQIPSLNPLSPLFSLQKDSISALRETGISQLDNLLTSLEMYVNALKNDSIPKDRLKPLLDELIQKKDELQLTVSKLPKNDELRTLVDGALYSVTQEAINFQSYN